MKKIVVVALLMGFVTAQASVQTQTSQNSVIAKKKSEPAPRDRDDRRGGGEQRDPREETYEGDGTGGATGGDSYCTFDCDTSGDGGGGGMIGEIFSPAHGGKPSPSNTNTKVEDRGEVLVYITTVQEEVSSTETCLTTIISVVDKASGKTLKTDSDRFCNVLSY